MLCAALCTSIISSLVPQSIENVKAEEGFPFSVKIEKNHLQNSSTGTWFDWDVSKHKGEEVMGSITVKNESQETITLEVRTSNALTSTTGGVDYNKADHTELTSFVDKNYAFKENITDLPETVTLQPGKIETIPFNVLVPENAIGEYVSSIGFYYINPEDKNTNVKREFGLNTTLLLRASKETIEPATFSNVKASLTQRIPHLTVNIANKSPMVHPAVQETYAVINKKTGETVFEGKIGPFKMAPSTQITYSINWSGAIATGEYTLSLGNGEQLDFELTKDYIKEVEQAITDVSVVKSELPWYVVSFITLLCLVVILLIVWLLVQRRRDQKVERPTSDEAAVSNEQTDLIGHEDLIELEKNEEKK